MEHSLEMLARTAQIHLGGTAHVKDTAMTTQSAFKRLMHWCARRVLNIGARDVPCHLTSCVGCRIQPRIGDAHHSCRFQRAQWQRLAHIFEDVCGSRPFYPVFLRPSRVPRVLNIRAHVANAESFCTR